MPPYAPSRQAGTDSPPSEDQFEGFGDTVSNTHYKGADFDMAEIDRIFETHKPKTSYCTKKAGSTSKGNYKPTKGSKSSWTTDSNSVLDEITEGFWPGQKKVM